MNFLVEKLIENDILRVKQPYLLDQEKTKKKKMLPRSPHYSRTTRPFRSLLISRTVILFILRRRTWISYMEQSICWNMDCLWQKFSRFMKTPLCPYHHYSIVSWKHLDRDECFCWFNWTLNLGFPFLFAPLFSSLPSFLSLPDQSVLRFRTWSLRSHLSRFVNLGWDHLSP